MNDNDGVIKADQHLATSSEIDTQELIGNDVSQSEVAGRGGTSVHENIRKAAFGLVIVVGIAISWVGATQFSKSTFSSEFSSASINVWFSTSWMLVCYPIYVLGCFVVLPRSRSVEGFRNLYRYAYYLTMSPLTSRRPPKHHVSARRCAHASCFA